MANKSDKILKYVMHRFKMVLKVLHKSIPILIELLLQYEPVTTRTCSLVDGIPPRSDRQLHLEAERYLRHRHHRHARHQDRRRQERC